METNAKTRRPSSGPRDFAIIIGGMKCGTTSLFDLLVQHPEVAGSREKEPNFFSSELDPAAAWDRYLELWDWDAAKHRIALEASTAYAKYPWVKEVPERIASSPGNSFRIIYMVRDPLRRIESQVRHGLYDGWGSSLDEELSDDLIDFSRYASQLDRYDAHFPRQRIFILPLERLKESPSDALRELCHFLGVSPDHEFTNADKPRNTGDFYTVPPIVRALARTRGSRWVLDRLLPRRIKDILRQGLSRIGRGHRSNLGRWKLTEDEQDRIRGLLASDMKRLRNEYGVEASWLSPSNGLAAEEGR